MLTYSTPSIITEFQSSEYETDVSILRARRHGYDDTIHVVKYLLDEVDKTQSAEKRTELAIKMFAAINANPSILIYEPCFRDCVMQKMKELEDELDNRVSTFKQSKYLEALTIFRQSVGDHIAHSQIRNEIDNYLRNIARSLSIYAGWAAAEKLRTEFAFLRAALERIRDHPDYVIVGGDY
jgi:hypothetical protein